MLTIQQVDRLELVTDGPDRILLDLVPADAAVFLAYTRAHVSQRIAFVVDGVVVVAPEILGPLGGSVELAIPSTGQAEQLYRRLGGQ